MKFYEIITILRQIIISIITVNWNSYDFLHLLIESLKRFTQQHYDLIVIDNSDKPEKINCAFQFMTNENLGHGKGLNLGVIKSLELFPNNPYTMFLDVDTHFISHNWDCQLLEKIKTCDVLAGRGVSSKPIRPACMFMKKEFSTFDWRDTEGYKGHRKTPEGFDVAIKAYYEMIKLGVKIDFLETKPNRYGTLNGEEFCCNEKPIVYHHWSGTWLNTRQQDFPNNDLILDKVKLFNSIPWRLP